MVTVKKTMTTVRMICGVLALTLLSGCATFYSEDGGFGVAESTAREHLGQEARWLKDEEDSAAAYEEVSAILKEPLSADKAVEIALLNNPGLQAAYAELGMTEADRVQAGRLPNPGFAYERTAGGGTKEIERALLFSVGSILTLPLRVSIENRRFEAAKLAAAADTIDVGLSAREAYFNAVAARQMTQYMRQVLDAAVASRDLMNRMARVGSSSRVELARERLFHADATTQLARAIQQETAARETLIRTLGLFGEQLEFSLPDRLPELPEIPRELENIEETALEQRLDVRMGRHQLEGLRTAMNWSGASYFINLLQEAGPKQTRPSGEPTREGYEIFIEIPLFDLGDARVAKAKAMYMQGVHRLRETAINARSQVREVYHAYQTAYDISKHYRDTVVPLRASISDDQLLHYNGMLIGVFELIEDARDQVVSVSESLQALRDFWLADTAIQRAMLGAGSPSMITAAQASFMPGGGQSQEH